MLGYLYPCSGCHNGTFARDTLGDETPLDAIGHAELAKLRRQLGKGKAGKTHAGGSKDRLTNHGSSNA